MLREQLPASVPVVPASQPLGVGQRDSAPKVRDTACASRGTISLKALARKVLARGSTPESCGTVAASKCPTTDSALGQHLGQRDTLADHRLKPAEWDAADWRAFYDERAGIAEFDGKMPRAKAEIMAFESCLLQWLRQHPARSDPDRCAWCGGTDRPGHVVVPFGTANAGHAWLHSLCWKPWHEKRRAAAAEALAALGLEPPRGKQP